MEYLGESSNKLVLPLLEDVGKPYSLLQQVINIGTGSVSEPVLF